MQQDTHQSAAFVEQPHDGDRQNGRNVETELQDVIPPRADTRDAPAEFTSHRVRFSAETLRPEPDFKVMDRDERVTKDEAEASPTKFEVAGKSATVNPNPTKGSQSHSATRLRGYSLRRSLFAQHLEHRHTRGNITVELGSPGSELSTLKRGVEANGNEEVKSRTMVSESIPEKLDFTTSGDSLAELHEGLPMYQRSLREHGGQAVYIKKLLNSWHSVRHKLSFAPTILRDLDGRHVQFNFQENENLIDERTSNPYISNIIRSCRYTPLNFFPRQLFAQFRKLANFYFLVVSVMQMIPGLSTTGTYTTIIPLLIFVGISMAKEGYDDIRRNRLDKEENERSADVLRQHSVHNVQFSEDLAPSNPQSSGRLRWQPKKWQNIKVGDVVLMKRNAPIPADVILLQADHLNGFAYIETKSLDGETNMKIKKALPEISSRCQNLESLSKLNLEFVVENPNLDLYKFDGKVCTGGKTLPLTNNEIIYRGSVLRNTPSAIGLVIYSGEECKIRMNANKVPRVKAPSLQALVNKIVVIIALMVLFIAIIMTVAYRIWRKTTEDKSWYLLQARVAFGQILASFIIMFNTMLPLSLYVSLEIVKVAQMFLMNDIDMYDPSSDTPMEAHTSTINEELGQVSHIFSDKTGTLTNNSMRFRKLSIAGTAWLHNPDLQVEAADEAERLKLRHKKRVDKGKTSLSVKKGEVADHNLRRKSGTPIVDIPTMKLSSIPNADWETSKKAASLSQPDNTEDLLEYIQHNPQTVFARRSRFFILALAICHTCYPEKDEKGNIEYQSASPDELALVTAAQELKYMATDRQANMITIKSFPNGDEGDPLYEKFEILDVIEFSSSRKRMSIVIRFPDNRICIFTKGADTTIRDLLRQVEKANKYASIVRQRADQRKSLEIQEALRRKSTQVQIASTTPRGSVSTSIRPAVLARNSSMSLGKPHTTRDSIDHWLREREREIEVSVPRTSHQHHSPRTSAQIGSSRLSNQGHGRQSFTYAHQSRSSSENIYNRDFIDEAMVLDEDIVFERCFQHIDDFATEGLRTLLFAYRYMTEDEYNEWKETYTAATTSLIDRQKKIEQAGALIETKLELLGATAIEDKLQKGVPDAIERFRRAGIKLWMLTGDKRETAINIGYSCRLIKDYSTVIILDHESGELSDQLTSAVSRLSDLNIAHTVLVIDGGSLAQIYQDSAFKTLFTNLAISADSVICCRASPSQKATLVRTIRTKVKGSVTLAVGDGANDIAMIQEAHLGIGIAGKEGLQAARTSDYSIAQFRFLLKLLLVHGRWNYVRICKYTLGTFWKEMFFYLVQAMYQRWTGYTGTSLYEPWSLSMFNTLFTSLPVIFMGVFEKDLSASTLLAVPELYSFGQRNGGFNLRLYIWWATLGACEAAIVYFTMYHIYGEALFTRDNQLYAMGALAFSSCVTIISIKLQVIELHNKSVAAIIAIFLSVGGWWLWNLLLSLIYPQNVVYNVNHGILDRFGKNPLWWLTLILIVAAVVLLEICLKSLCSVIWPTDVDIFQAYEQDIEVRKRFEEAAADLLQQGWNRGTKKSSLELEREAAEQREREAQVQQLLERPRQIRQDSNEPAIRQRHSSQIDDSIEPHKPSHANEHGHVAHGKSVDTGDLFSKGFGSVKKGPDLH